MTRTSKMKVAMMKLGTRGLVLAALCSAFFALMLSAPMGLGSTAREHIIGGSPVPDPSAYPFTAALLNANEPDAFQAQFCGGTLIAPSWVVTAGHCVSHGNTVAAPSSFDVAVGAASLFAVTPSTRLKASAIYRHPEFQRLSDGTSANDIALVRLATPVTVPAVLMPSAEDMSWISGRPTAVIAGWGRTDAYDPRYAAATLQVGYVTVFEQAACAYAYGFSMLSGELCAGNWAGSPAVCNGDSGGPLLRLSSDNRWVLIGVTNWGPPFCASPGQPPVFASIPYYRRWIDSVLSSAPPPSLVSPGCRRVGNEYLASVRTLRSRAEAHRRARGSVARRKALAKVEAARKLRDRRFDIMLFTCAAEDPHIPASASCKRAFRIYIQRSNAFAEARHRVTARPGTAVYLRQTRARDRAQIALDRAIATGLRTCSAG